MIFGERVKAGGPPRPDLLNFVPKVKTDHLIQMDSVVQSRVKADALAREKVQNGGVSIEPEGFWAKLLKETGIKR